MKRRRKSLKEYKQDLTTLRHYSNAFGTAQGFNLTKGLTPAKKRDITLNITKLRALMARPHKEFKPRSAIKLRQAIADNHAGKHIKGLKVAFIPTANPKADAIIRISTQGKVSISQGGVKKINLHLDPVQLALDPVNTVKEAIKDSKAKRFAIMAGEYIVGVRGAQKYDIHPFSSRKEIPYYTAKLISQYGADKFDPNDKNSHYFGNWLIGIVSYEYEKIKDYYKYQDIYERQRNLILSSSYARRLALKKKKSKKKSKRK